MQSIEFKTIKTPDLIQRGSFRAIEENQIKGLDSLIEYDYMGSSEFEFGALNNSLKRITASWIDYTWFPIDDIQDADGQTLYVLCKKGTKDEVTQAIKILAAEKYPFHTKEHVDLYEYIHAETEHSQYNNFWWDVTSENNYRNDLGTGNDWMACFGNNIRLLVIAIKIVCFKHGVSEVGPGVPPISKKPIRPDLKIEDDYRNDEIKILYPDGTKTIIKKRKIVETNFSNDEVIKVLVLTRSGKPSWIEIKVPLSSTRSIICNHLKEWPEFNRIHAMATQKAN